MCFKNKVLPALVLTAIVQINAGEQKTPRAQFLYFNASSNENISFFISYGDGDNIGDLKKHIKLALEYEHGITIKPEQTMRIALSGTNASDETLCIHANIAKGFASNVYIDDK
jgi:hypothetical protein